jgi:hypothetical protein
MTNIWPPIDLLVAVSGPMFVTGPSDPRLDPVSIVLVYSRPSSGSGLQMIQLRPSIGLILAFTESSSGQQIALHWPPSGLAVPPPKRGKDGLLVA